MPDDLTPETRELLAYQSGIIARSQSTSSGLSSATMRSRARYGHWQRPHRGVYADTNGEISREAKLWAALLRAGPGATLSHQSAAERHGLLNEPSQLIHVTVPADRHPARWSNIPGIVVHRSTWIERIRHPTMTPPCTRVEDTVLDLIAAARTFDEAYGWICRAIGRRRTTAERLRAALDARKKFRWRQELERALGDAGDGVLSWLERRYVNGIERPHGLPKAKRQVRIAQDTGNKYLDNLYDAYLVCVELDGTAANPAAEQWHDKRRDNWNLVHENTVTLRFGYLDVRTRRHRCETAAIVATLLRSRAPISTHSCGLSACPVA